MAKRPDVAAFLDISRDAGLNETQLKSKYSNLIFIENKETDTQGFITVKSTGELCSGVSKKAVIISFRGSQEKQDWINDFTAWHTVIPYGNYESDIRVHQGFLTCYKSVRGDILSYISKNRSEIYNIYITGHSLGGALATLCAVDIQFNFPDIKLQVYTSGAPKVGNKAFVRSYNKRVPDTTRTYARQDIVPKLPPVWLFERLSGGYAHVDKGYAIGPKDFWSGLKYFFSTSKTNFAANLTNHSIELYEKWC